MTREHVFFVPAIFLLGFTLGALALHWQQARTGRVATAARLPLTVRAWGLAAPLVAFVLIFVLTHLLQVPGSPRALTAELHGQQMFDQQPSFSAEEVYERMAAFGASGRAAYRQLLFSADLLFPLVLFTFLVQLTRFVALRLPALSTRVQRTLLLVPLSWLLSDLLENAIIAYLLDTFPTQSDALAARLGTVTDVKFTLLVASLCVPALLVTQLGRTNQRARVAT